MITFANMTRHGATGFLRRTRSSAFTESRQLFLSHPALAGILFTVLLGHPLYSAAGIPSQGAPPADEPGWFSAHHLTGDWSGVRGTLEARGVEFFFDYTHEYLANVSGGIRRGGQYNGLVVAGVEVDLEKVAGWQGGFVHVDGLYTLGQSLSEIQVGDDGNVSNINFPNSVRLFEAWVQQSLFEGKVALRAGQLAFDSDFADTAINEDLPGGTLFIYGDFGAIPILSFNVPAPLYAISAPGVMLRVEPIRNFYVQSAVYDGNPSQGDFGDPSPNAGILAPSNNHNVRWRVSGDEGVLWVIEFGFQLNPASGEELYVTAPESPLEYGSRVVHEADGTTGDLRPTSESGKKIVFTGPGLPGVYKFGFFYHSDEFTDRTGADDTSEYDGDYGIYALTAQMVWREEGNQGLTLFARAGFAPEDRNVLNFTFEGGCVYKGLIPIREEDDFGLAVSYKRYSADFSAAEVSSGGDPRSHESIIEATYAANITGWMSVQPVVQYIWNPAGVATASDAWIMGVRSSIAF
jgi:porin